jgi:transglutaminase-like putative cysteine protease
MKKILIAIVFLATMSISAQDYKFGEVSKEEVVEKYYPSDSTASAAYLYKGRKTFYNYNNNSGFEIVNEFYVRLKVYNKDGFDYATFSVPYFRPKKGKSERVYSIKANTYNVDENGQVTKDKLSKKNIFDETVSKFRHIKKVTMPNVKEGSVIELKYTVTSPYYTVIDEINYQFNIPVKKFYANIETPEWLTFKKVNRGYYLITPKETKRNGSITFRDKVRTTTKKNSGPGASTVNSAWQSSKRDLTYNKSVYEAENIPPLKDNEPYVSSISSYRGGVKYEIAGTRFPNSTVESFSNTWQDVSKQIYKSSNFGGELEKDSYFKEDLAPILAEAKTRDEKIMAVLQFVKSKVKWNNYFGKSTNKGVKKAYKDGIGNSAEINLMLTSMLRFAGLEANPVLVSTSSNGIPLFPTLNGFNYVISIVDLPGNTFLLLDATEPYSLPNILPTRALNWNGRKVTKSGASSWVQLTSSILATEDDNVNIKISEDLEVEGLVRIKYDNLKALNYRSRNNHIKEEIIKANLEEEFKIEIENFKIANKNKISQPISVMAKFSSEDLIEEINDKLYINPLLFYAQKTNPFKLEERKFPVDFSTPWKDKHSVSIQIPEGYKVESLPAPMAIGLPDNLGVFKYQVKQAGAKIITVSLLQFNSALIGAKNYKTLKLFYGDLVKKQSEKIVLVKQ